MINEVAGRDEREVRARRPACRSRRRKRRRRRERNEEHGGGQVVRRRQGEDEVHEQEGVENNKSGPSAGACTSRVVGGGRARRGSYSMGMRAGRGRRERRRGEGLKRTPTTPGSTQSPRSLARGHAVLTSGGASPRSSSPFLGCRASSPMTTSPSPCPSSSSRIAPSSRSPSPSPSPSASPSASVAPPSPPADPLEGRLAVLPDAWSAGESSAPESPSVARSVARRGRLRGVGAEEDEAPAGAALPPLWILRWRRRLDCERASERGSGRVTARAERVEEDGGREGAHLDGEGAVAHRARKGLLARVRVHVDPERRRPGKAFRCAHARSVRQRSGSNPNSCSCSCSCEGESEREGKRERATHGNAGSRTALRPAATRPRPPRRATAGAAGATPTGPGGPSGASSTAAAAAAAGRLAGAAARLGPARRGPTA